MSPRTTPGPGPKPDTTPASSQQVTALMAAITLPDGTHLYLSTACMHGRHRACGIRQFARGDLTPPHCKHCASVCVCPECDHPAQPDDPTSPLGMLLTTRGQREPERAVIS